MIAVLATLFIYSMTVGLWNIKTKNMETKTVSDRMISLVVLNDMHTNFLAKAIDGISDKDAHNRLNTKANHVAWLTGSLVQQRYEMAKHIGPDSNADSQLSADELFKNNKGIQDDIIYPPLAEFKKDFDKATPALRNALINVSDEKLDQKFEMMPGMQMTYYELMSFRIYREASIIGQIALWRRLLVYDALKYD